MLSALLVPGAAAAISWTVNGIAHKNTSLAVAGAGTAAVLLGLSVTVTPLCSAVVLLSLGERVRFHVEHHVLELTTTIPSITHHEDPAAANRIGLLQDAGRWRLSASAAALGDSLRLGLTSTISLFLLASVDPALLLLAVFGVPAVLTRRWAMARNLRFRTENAESVRHTSRLFNEASKPANGLEVRVFGLRTELLRRFSTAHRDVHRADIRMRTIGGLVTTAGRAVFVAAYIAMIALTALKVREGEASPGDLAMVIVLGAEVGTIVSDTATQADLVSQILHDFSVYGWLISYAAQQNPAPDTPANPAAINSVPTTLVDGIRFEGVTFRYPKSTNDTLKEIDLFLPSGSTIALVGDNGSGKSTLINLMGRFYEPTEGRITVDGVDIRDFDAASWREVLSAQFQNFTRFEFSLQLSVGVGDLSHLNDAARITEALTRADADTLAARLPCGLTTQLGRRWEGGVDLSGGQWQRVALGRALMRTAPSLLLLDEPAAALDPETEQRLLDRFITEAKTLALKNGGIVVIVSHRFSTVRSADVIAVLENGRIVEYGTHDQLIASNDRYARMFTLQASGYR
ncbi:ABC transporter ATP-binding protein [Streptomyces sp. NPDC056831]|uniref:ABC transporter ATP-binding protein n=1 Tax=Streptomyces sp. NPDC056831 TaxID=3345954 RepID=UPI0036CA8CD2